jgi:hypothetical protein
MSLLASIKPGQRLKRTYIDGAIADSIRTVYPERHYSDVEIVAHHAERGYSLPFSPSIRPRTTPVEPSGDAFPVIPGRNYRNR